MNYQRNPLKLYHSPRKINKGEKEYLDFPLFFIDSYSFEAEITFPGLVTVPLSRLWARERQPARMTESDFGGRGKKKIFVAIIPCCRWWRIWVESKARVEASLQFDIRFPSSLVLLVKLLRFKPFSVSQTQSCEKTFESKALYTSRRVYFSYHR